MMKGYDGSDAEQAPEPEPEPERIKVGIAEYEVTSDGAVLSTSGLGSCIGVALHDPATGVAGLVHVMLPTAEEARDGAAAKFADAGTDLLLSEMERAGAAVATVEAKITGGSDMLDFSGGGSGIGERNVGEVRSILERRDVPIVAEDVGGDHGRSVQLRAETGDYVVKTANEGSRTL
jgi:chemotaxis protein CheD